jgi:hypothetical protein
VTALLCNDFELPRGDCAFRSPELKRSGSFRHGIRHFGHREGSLNATRAAWPLAVSSAVFVASHAFAAEPLRVELNAAKPADDRCRLTFVLDNRAKQAVESLKLDLAVFDSEGVVANRLVIEMGPVRAAKTVVRTFSVEQECKQVGAILVNEIAACAPGDPESCLDGLELSSRVKGVRFYK